MCTLMWTLGFCNILLNTIKTATEGKSMSRCPGGHSIKTMICRYHVSHPIEYHLLFYWRQANNMFGIRYFVQSSLLQDCE